MEINELAKKLKGKKVKRVEALIALPRQKGLIFMGDEEDEPNCEEFFFDGRSLTIPYVDVEPTPQAVPLELAMKLQAEGRIKSFRANIVIAK